MALLASMAFGFFTTAGFFSATVLLIVICAAGWYLLRGLPTAHYADIAAAAARCASAERSSRKDFAVGQTIFIPREIEANEPRVAASPDTVKRLAGLGFDVIVEAGAGRGLAHSG